MLDRNKQKWCALWFNKYFIYFINIKIQNKQFEKFITSGGGLFSLSALDFSSLLVLSVEQHRFLHSALRKRNGLGWPFFVFHPFFSKLENILDSGTKLDTKWKYLTGEWFYEAKSRRHMDKIHGSEIILASMKPKKSPLGVFILSCWQGAHVTSMV